VSSTANGAVLDDDTLGAVAIPGAEHQVVRAGPVTFDIEVVRRGSGPRLLYLHGIDGLHTWPAGLERLASHFTIVAPHLPGFGVSRGLEALDDVHDVAIFLQDLLDALGIDRVPVIGHSLGGMFAAELAAAAPHRVTRLALLAPFGLWLDDAPVADLVGVLRKDRLRLAWHDLEHPVAAALAQPLADPADALARDLLETQHLIGAGKFLWGVPDRGLAKRLHRVAAPTLVLWGAQDRVMRADRYGAAFQRLVPNASLRLLPDAGHNVPLEHPEPFASAILSFLGANPPSPQGGQ
jgi:pimeloyl-ACP methyl ester carboxylesterase